MVVEEMEVLDDNRPNNNVETSKYNQYPYVDDQMCYLRN